MPNFETLTPHERAALARAAAQVEHVMERPWIAERRRQWLAALLKMEGV